MEKVKSLCSLICLCSLLGISKKRFKKTVKEIEELLPSKDLSEEEEIIRKLGILFFEKSYSAGKNKIELTTTILPSEDAFYSEIDAVMEKVLPRLEDKKEMESLVKKTKASYRDLSVKKKGSLFFALRCEPGEEEDFLDVTDLWKLRHPIKEFLGIVKQMSPKFVPTQCCLRFSFPLKEHKFVGGFALPTKIPISQKVAERLGEADVSGFHLSFKESPLNIRRIEIRLKGDNIAIFAEFSSKMHISEKVFQEVYEYGVQASKLFVEVIE